MDRKNPQRARDPFGAEPKTAASPTSGNYRATRPLIVEEVVVARSSELRRKYVDPVPEEEHEVPMRDWTPGDDCMPTPRPHVGLRTKPRVTKHPSELEEVPLEPRAAFLLSLIDGKSSTQTLVDASGMDEDEVLELLERLAVFGVIAVDP